MESGGGGAEAPHYPRIVLVTGACRFLGGYLTARLAQNPMINKVIAVDAIAPSRICCAAWVAPSSCVPTSATLHRQGHPQR